MVFSAQLARGKESRVRTLLYTGFVIADLAIGHVYPYLNSKFAPGDSRLPGSVLRRANAGDSDDSEGYGIEERRRCFFRPY
jgi:hypothetical protein